MVRSGVLCVFFLWFTCLVFGQVTPLYPDMPTTYSVNEAIINPAYIHQNGHYVLSGIYKFQFDEPNIAIYDVNGAAIFDKTNSKQSIRLAFSNEKEGPYISTPRGNINYAYQLSVSQDTRIAAGISLGFVNRFYNAPSSTGQGNVIMPDGNLGIRLLYKKWAIGMTVMQFLNSEGSVLQSKLKLNTYYHLHASWQQVVGLNWKLKENVLLRILPEVGQQIIGGISVDYLDFLELGVCYYQRRGVAFQLLVASNQAKNLFKISVGYNSSLLSESPLWSNSVELGLNYSFQ